MLLVAVLLVLPGPAAAQAPVTITGAALVALEALADASQPVAPGTAGTLSLLGGCVYTTTPPAATNGQGLADQCDTAGRRLVSIEPPIPDPTRYIYARLTSGTDALAQINGEVHDVPLDLGEIQGLIGMGRAYATASPPTAVSDPADAVGAWMDLRGAVHTVATNNGTAIFPVNAALADNTANPTLSGIGTYTMCFDGATWDRCPMPALNIGAVDAVTQRVVPSQVTSVVDYDVDEEAELDDGAGEYCGISFTNRSTAERIIKIYLDDSANVTVGTTVPNIVIPIPGNATDFIAGNFGTPSGCLAYTNGLTIAATTDLLDDGTPAYPGANEVVVTVYGRGL